MDPFCFNILTNQWPSDDPFLPNAQQTALPMDPKCNGNGRTLILTPKYEGYVLQIFGTQTPKCLHIYEKPADTWFIKQGLASY